VPRVADLQTPVAHQPCQRPLYQVPVAAELAGRLDAAAGDPRGDPAPAERPSAARVVVELCRLGAKLRTVNVLL